MKNREGVLQGAAKGGLLAKRAADEQALKEWIAADPRRHAEYGDALTALDRLEAEKERTRERTVVFQSFTTSSSLFSAARTILAARGGAAEEGPRPRSGLPGARVAPAPGGDGAAG